MTKCPHCGFEPPKAPYRYIGYWDAYLPDILELLRKGYKPDRVVDVLEMRYLVKPLEARLMFPPRRPSKSTVSYIGRRYGIIPPAPVKPKIDYKQRDKEIVTRYLAGAECDELAKDHGISVDRIRYIVRWEIFSTLYDQRPNIEWVKERREELLAARWLAKASIAA